MASNSHPPPFTTLPPDIVGQICKELTYPQVCALDLVSCHFNSMELKWLWINRIRERVAQWDEKVDENGEPLITDKMHARYMWIMVYKPQRLKELLTALQGGHPNDHSKNYDDEREEEAPYEHVATERSARILQRFPPEILSLITKHIEFEDLYPLRLTSKYFRTTMASGYPSWLMYLGRRLWEFSGVKEGMVMQQAIDLSWLARENKRLVCNDCVYLLPESKFDTQNRTGMKKRGGFRGWFRKCIKCGPRFGAHKRNKRRYRTQ